MRLIIAGSRGIENYQVLLDAIKQYNIHSIQEIISGEARGVDTLGIRYAYENDIPLKRFPANWEKKGKLAGRIRNVEMANYAHEHKAGALLAIWDLESTGTGHMIDTAHKMGMKVFLYSVARKET